MRRRYTDRNSVEIFAGDIIRLADNSIKTVYATTSADGTEDLSVIATNPNYLKNHPNAEIEYYSLSFIGSRNVELAATLEESQLHKETIFAALENGFTASDLDRITVRRYRPSVTQSSAFVCVDGQQVMNFSDPVYLRHNDGSYSDGFHIFFSDEIETFENVIDDYGTITPENHFISAALNHPLDHVYHYSDKIRRALAK